MNQVTHIFAKDTRRHWPEIAISLLVTAAWVWMTPYSWDWRPENTPTQGAQVALVAMMFLAGLAAALVPVMWWILITRVVQGENLVGDTQWWVTKPYEWEKLLTAKTLFLAAFIAAPMLVADWILLAEAGLKPVDHVAGLGFRTLLLVCFVLLPLGALAAVTSTFARVTLTTIGTVLVLGVNIGVLAGVERYKYSSSLGLLIAVPLLLGLIVGAVVFQYARRRTWQSRGWLLASLAVIVCGGYLSYSPVLVALEFPQNGAAPIQIGLEEQPSIAMRTEENRVSLTLPVTIAGVQQGSGTQLDAVRVTMTTAAGRTWRSGWEALYGQRYMSVKVTRSVTTSTGMRQDSGLIPVSSEIYVGPTTGMVDLGINRAFYDMARAEPVTLQLELAVTELKAGNAVVVPMQTSDFAVAGLGECSPLKYGIRCRSALRQPQLTFVRTEFTEGTCAANGAGAEVSGSAWMGDLSRAPADFGLSPVSDIATALSNFSGPPAPGQPPVLRHLCPGTPITFTPYAVTGRTRVVTTLRNITLPEWK